MKEKKVSVAIDLCRDYSQIAYYTEGMQEGVSVSVVPGEERFLIPMVIAKRYQWDEWYIGEVAEQYLEKEEAVGVTDLLSLAQKKQAVTLEGKKYEALELLQYFFEKMLAYLPMQLDGENLQVLMFTVEKQSQELVNDIYFVTRQMGIDKSRVVIIGHAESFIYYNIFQKKELRSNDVVVFDFNKYTFSMKHFRILRSSRTPVPVHVEEKDYSELLNFAMLEQPDTAKRADEIFANLVDEISKQSVISTIYLTGCGFYQNWLDTSLKALCNKHRAFQGYNLFVKGAIYGAMDRAGKGDCERYLFVCAGRTLADVELEVMQGGEACYLMLSKAGKNWYEAGARLECILDNTKEVKVRLSSALNSESKEEIISLEGFPERPNRTTRIEITFAYDDSDKGILYIKDKGFGELFPASDACIRSEIIIC